MAALFWTPSSSPIPSLQFHFHGNSTIQIPFVPKPPSVSKIPTCLISVNSVSAPPNFLNPKPSLQRFHCSTSSTWSSSTEPDESHSTIIFIKGLPLSTSEGTLMTVFSQFGEVSRVKIITDKKTKQSLGFAYLWFSSEESAQMAVKEINGKFFEGRFVLVTIAKPGSCKSRIRTKPYKF